MVSGKHLYQQLKNIYHYCQAQFWRAYYRWPDKGLKLYGVTGTNGKTTTCVVLGAVLRSAYGKEKVGLLTTIFFWFGVKELVNKSKMTTLDSRDVFKMLREMVNGGVEHVVLEATSHALDQNRLAGVRLDGGIILNLFREHLDYHGDMESYKRAKGLIVDLLSKNAPLVVNKDNKWTREIVDETLVIRQRLKLKVVWLTRQQAVSIKTELMGEWNKENVLAVRLLAKEIGISEHIIDEGVNNVSSVPGRMEWITVNPKAQSTNSKHRLPRVLIDYAVTPDALERVYKEVKKKTKGKIFAVLGACGNRDRGKRSEMARMVAKYADELVLTREDPWTESEEQIYRDLEQGLADTPIKGKRIVDRRDAIRHCLKKAGSSDVVVVTGKGAEVGMAVGNKIIPWRDVEVAQEELEKLFSERISS